jgi:outer membrane lipoprotein SlyB
MHDETFWKGMFGAVVGGVLFLQVGGPLGGLLGALAGAITGAVLNRIQPRRGDGM